MPVPADAPPCRFRHPEARRAEQGDGLYHDAEARLVGYVCRWDFQNEAGERDKEILPVTFCDLGNGRFGWRVKGIPGAPPAVRPAGYPSPAGAADPDRRGREVRDAAATLFPDMVVTHAGARREVAAACRLAPRRPRSGDRHRLRRTRPENRQGQAASSRPRFRRQGLPSWRAPPARSRCCTCIPIGSAAWRWQNGESIFRGGRSRMAGISPTRSTRDGPRRRLPSRGAIPAFLPPLSSMPGARPAPRSWSRKCTGRSTLVFNGVEKRIERVDKETGTVTVEWRGSVRSWRWCAETRSAEGEEWGRLFRHHRSRRPHQGMGDADVHAGRRRHRLSRAAAVARR